MLPGVPIPTVWPPLLYAETHYRFRFLPSLLKKAEPEILADAPHRIDPGAPLPLLILAKDADRYPGVLHSVKVRIRQDGLLVKTANLISTPERLHGRFWWRVYSIPIEAISRWIECDVEMILEIDGERRSYMNDNLRGASHQPLRIFVSSHRLPCFDGWFQGEGHSHSDRTDDQVEFGVPPGPAKELSRSLGLQFACITDHSYDLDDHPHDFLQNHAERPKWASLQNEIDGLNDGISDFCFVRGEEVSCRTRRGKNVHLLLLGTRSFVPGSGDSAERWLRTWSELSIADVLRMRDDGTAAFAAHARERISWIQRILLGRGIWEMEDLSEPGLDGVQFANGKSGFDFDDGLRAWIDLLQEGRKSVILGGNDAHGNFNRFRQIGIPFVRIRESEEQLFGVTRTVVRSDTLTEQHLLDAIRRGRSVVSDGPVIDIQCTESGETSLGSIVQSPKTSIVLKALTSPEYGGFTSVRLIHGIAGRGERTVINLGNTGDRLFERCVLDTNERGYIRAEAMTSAEGSQYGRSHFCFTNPVWLEQ